MTVAPAAIVRPRPLTLRLAALPALMPSAQAVNAGALYLMIAAELPVRRSTEALQAEYPGVPVSRHAADVFLVSVSAGADEVLIEGASAIGGDNGGEVNTYTWSAPDARVLLLSDDEQANATAHPGSYRYVSALQVEHPGGERTLYWLKGLNSDADLAGHLNLVLADVLGLRGITEPWVSQQVTDAAAGLTLHYPLPHETLSVGLYVLQGADLYAATAH